MVNKVDMNDAYLETDSMQYWSYSDLITVERAKELHIFFRREFIVVLHAIIREFAPRTA